MLALWTFREYLLPSGKGALEDWYKRQSSEVQGAYDVALEYLAQRSRDEWRRPDFDLLSGKMREIGEIRFKADRKQYRILGFFGPATHDFTLLIGCSKKGPVYDPKSSMKVALERKAQIQSNRSRCRVCSF